MMLGVLTASLSRKGGGLFWAVQSLAHGLAATGCDVEVFGGHDSDTNADRPLWNPLAVNIFLRWGPSAFGYMPKLSGALCRAELDLLHIHGLWMYPSVAARDWAQRFSKGYIISPHGMLDPWAIRNSRWKKRIAGFLYENAHLRGAACLHALCDAEYQAIRAYGLQNPVAVIPNGVELPTSPSNVPPDWEASLPMGAKVLLYLGRIHPKKGLRELLPAWGEVVRQKAWAEEWFLVVAGWDQGGHEDELKRLARELGIEGRIRFVGPQFGEAKQQAFERAQAFVLPSFSEGLPMVVLEAWAYGLPVLMTPQCNLPEGFNAGAALSVAPEAASIFDGLSELGTMSERQRLDMGARGRQLVAKRFSWDKIAADMYAVYQWVLGRGSRPDSLQS